MDAGMVLLMGILVLCVGRSSSAPAALPRASQTTYGTPPSLNTSVRDSHERPARSPLTLYDVSPPIHPDPAPASPYYADLAGRPAPRPPTLTTELTPPPVPCMDDDAPCDTDTMYRTYSGRCNNLQHSEQGTPGQPQISILPQRYDSPAVFRMRSVTGRLLPNPRHLSLMLSHAPQGPKITYNSLFMEVGQLIDHDFVITTIANNPQGGRMNCGGCSSWDHPACVPFPIPANDPFKGARTHANYEPKCHAFTRSVAYLETDSQGRRTLRQPNLKNAFLDMSPIYGNNPCVADSLRRRTDGHLISGANRMLIKLPAKHFPHCFSDDGFCYHSGDLRGNENIGLAALHTAFHRAHNGLAEGLKAVNPHWGDERLFQEARRINIAQYQNIVYAEYVPALLGYHTAAKQRLIPHHQGYFLGYDPSVHPGVYNEFSTAAFRMGHSQVSGYVTLMNEHFKVTHQSPLHFAFFNSTLLNQAGYDSLFRGLFAVSLKPADLRLVDDLSNNLFVRKDKPTSGFDLFAININRGRDHGLAPYVDYLVACGVKRVSSFADLHSLMPRETVALLSKAYADVRDIDLFPGGLAETPVPGALVGPTFTCIIARQFLAAKMTDRFWFEGPGAGFTHAQLKSLRQVSLSRVICAAMDHQNALVPPAAFRVPDPLSNPLQRCSDLPKVDLALWREQPHAPPAPCKFQGQSFRVGRPVPVSSCLLCVCQPDGTVKCQCDMSGCTQAPREYYCRRICGHPGPSLQPHYRQ